jgi:hypothetical protein
MSETDSGAMLIVEDEMFHIARDLESGNPLWIVVYGVYTGQFIAFPRFHVPSGTIAVAYYPGALSERLREIEQWACGCPAQRMAC